MTIRDRLEPSWYLPQDALHLMENEVIGLKSIRAIFSILILTCACVLGASTAAASGASRTQASPAFCTGTGPILATKISSPLKLGSCPIEGRELVQALKNGIIVGGINVPASGYSEGNALLTISGEYELTAVNYNGILTVRQFQESNPPRTAITSAPVACSQTNYNYEGSQWNATDKWYYNESTAGESGLGVSSTLSDIRSAINNMTNGVNDCGYSGEFAAGGSFQGDTSLFANINSSAMCTSNFPDGQSTVGWQYFNPALTFALADTCWYSFAGHMEEADIAFAPNVGFVDQLPNNCTSSYDLQSAATHEWGHVFGLAHASGWAETMYSQSSLCHTYERTLGNGDWTAMANLYGFR